VDKTLDDSLVGHEFNISPFNLAPEHREHAAHTAANFSWFARKSCELFGIQKNVVNSVRACLEIHFLVDGGTRFVRSGTLSFVHLFLGGSTDGEGDWLRDKSVPSTRKRVPRASASDSP